MECFKMITASLLKLQMAIRHGDIDAASDYIEQTHEEIVHLRNQIMQLEQELAEVKTTAVIPIEIFNIFQIDDYNYNNSDLLVECKNEEDAATMVQWLYDRMKETKA